MWEGYNHNGKHLIPGQELKWMMEKLELKLLSYIQYPGLSNNLYA